MNRTHIGFAWMILSFSQPMAASESSKISIERLFTDQKGFVTCAGGGTSAPLFTRECRTITVSRVSMNGSIKYEMTCTDSNETKFMLACDAFSFEYSTLVSHNPFSTKN